MNAILAILSVLWGDLRRNAASALATLAALAAGVGVFVAIYLASTAARSSFVSAVEAVAGHATHEILSPGGIKEERLPVFSTHPSVVAAQPVVEGWVAVRALFRGEEEIAQTLPPLRILGLDPFLAGPFWGADQKGIARTEGSGAQPPPKTFQQFLTEPSCLIVPKEWAESAGARAGDRLRVSASGRVQEWNILAVYSREDFGESSRDTALMDIAAAQEAFQREGRLTRIDLILKPESESALRPLLAPGEQLETPRNRGERVAKMIEAFRLNLLALGLLALAVGALLVYNAAQFAVVRRSGMLGQLRCLGATRRMIFAAAMGEALWSGLVGGALGLLLGNALSNYLSQSLTRAITDLYAFVHVEEAQVGAGLVLATLVGAAVISGCAAFLPAVDAAHAAPRMVGQGSREEQRFRARLPRLLLLAGLFALLGLAALLLPVQAEWPGFVAAFAFLGAGAALQPSLMSLILPRLQGLAERRGWTTMAISTGTLLRALSRSGGAAAALGVALAMTIGVVVMVSSFESEVRNWILTALQADLYVADVAEQVSRAEARVPEAAIEEMRRTPGVRGLDILRVMEVPYAGRSFLFYGVDWSVPESRERYIFLEGRKDEALDKALAGAAIISEPLSTHYGLHLGDTLVVPGQAGEERIEVAGVFRDYSHDRGYALTGKGRFIACFGDPGPRNVALYLQRGADKEKVAANLREAFKGRFDLTIRSNADLRAGVLEIFKRTFGLTYALQAIAMIMALSGTAATLVGLFLERAREIATLRALGASRRRIGGLFASEALLMAFFPVLLALPVGALLAWILLHVVNLRSFGWTIAFSWPWGTVLQSCALAALASLSAALVPWALSRRHSIAASLREE